MKNSNRTKYPEIFEPTYWDGTGVYKTPTEFNKHNRLVSDKIIENRNKFVEEFDISHESSYHKNKGYSKRLADVKQLLRNSENSLKVYDHPEVYRTKDGKFILVFSPYTYPKETFHDDKVWNLFTEYNSLYSDKSSTYIMIFDDYKEVSSFLKYVKIVI